MPSGPVPQPWQTIARRMQDHRDETIAAVQPPVPDVPAELPTNVTGVPRTVLAPAVLDITESPVEVLLPLLHEGRLSSTAVTTAFLQRAGLAGRLANCITELLPERALARARFLDEHRAQHKQPIGPLHGLPISVKEHFGMKGQDLNAGFVAWAGRVADADALLLQFLWTAGAVFYVRTTQPQSLMHLETSSNLYGVTVNPYNAGLTSGGSSGGEGALLGLRGSCLGVGSDIGGSIRAPAANNGVFGLRPTTTRLPTGGIMAAMLGADHIVPVVGPMATSLEGIRIFMQALLDQRPWLSDASLVQMPWKRGSSLRVGTDGRKKLRVGVLVDDGVVRPHPPILRGLETVVAKLGTSPDVEVVDFPPWKHEEASRIISSLYFADGAAELSEAINASGEPWRPLSTFVAKENPNIKVLTIPELWELTKQKEAYKTNYTKHWNSIGTSLPGPDSITEAEVQEVSSKADDMVDVLLTPVGPGCAPPLDSARYWAYTSQWNLLDYPALVFPTGLWCGSEDKAREESPPRNEQDKYNRELCKCLPVAMLCGTCRSMLICLLIDQQDVYVDAPISLQLVGRRFEDEKLVEALEMILKVADISTVAIV
nr:putative amidase [Quercus suber]